MREFTHHSTPYGRIMSIGIVGFQPEGDCEVIDSGNYLPHLLLQHLPEGLSMIVRFINGTGVSTFCAPEVPFTDVQSNLNEAFGGGAGNIFWWAEPSSNSPTIVHLELIGDVPSDIVGWGAPVKALGLNLTNGPKIIKRMKEIVRSCAYNDKRRPNIHWFMYLGDPIAIDGGNCMSRKKANLMGIPKWVRRVNLRVMGPTGLVKGDATIISNAQMRRTWGQLYDFVVPTVNLKNEIATSGWWFATASAHHPHNQAMWDVQSASWLRTSVYPEALMKETLTNILDEGIRALEAGEWPDWMLLSEGEAHLDDSSSMHILEKAEKSFHNMGLRWQMHGLDVQASASILGMAANAFVAKLSSRLYRKSASGRPSPKLWYPLPWAMYGHVSTTAVIEELCGYTVPEEYRDKVWYHNESHSIIYPTDEFVRDFENHGTHDNDDGIRLLARTTEDGVKGLVGRSPNSDGEYSVHDIVLETLPLHHTFGEMPYMELAQLPPQIAEVQVGQIITGLPSDNWVRDSYFTEREANHSLQMELINPGVGPLANAMMVYYATFKCSPAMAPASMGDMVDALQQTPSEGAFTEINAFVERLWDEIQSSGATVDRHLKTTRVPRTIEVEAHSGYFQRLYLHFQAEVARFKEESRPIAFRKRAEHAVSYIMEMPISDEEFATGAQWMKLANERFAQVRAEANRMRKLGLETQAKRFSATGNKEVVRKVRDALLALDIPTRDMRIFAMYRWAVRPGANAFQRYGKEDYVLFNPAGKGEQTVMDLFCEGLIRAGVAHEPAIREVVAISAEDLSMQIIQAMMDS